MIVDGNEFSGELYPSTNYSPVGVVVVPGHHDVYKDGSCAILSLKYMNTNEPDTGTNDADFMNWCGDETLSVAQTLKVYSDVCYVGVAYTIAEQVQGVTDESALPSDKFSSKENPFDKETFYHANRPYASSPSPYKNDGTFNSEYSKTEAPSSTENALSDFNGLVTTRKMCKTDISAADWKTYSDIPSGGFSPAYCCWRYHTNGTSQGSWYLPACGELGYMIVRFKKINEAIEKLITIYGESYGAIISGADYFWASTNCGYHLARDMYSGDGGIYNDGYSGAHCVRSFLRLNANGIIPIE